MRVGGREGLAVKLKLAVCASDKCAVCLVNQLLHALFSCLSSSSCDIREIRKFIAKPSSMHKRLVISISH